MSRLQQLTLAAAGAVVAVAIAVGVAGAVGGGVPDDAVAKVEGSDTITRETFNHWMRVAAAGQQPPGGKRGEIKTPKKGDPQYNTLRDQVMQFLISAAWIQGEAADRGVEATDRQVDKKFEETKDQSFSNEGEYRKFLRNSGMSQGDVNFRVKLDLLSEDIRTRVTGGNVKKVPAEEVEDYYEINKARFTQPERRDLRVVLNKSEDQVKKAKSELEADKDWEAVAKKYSTDEATKNEGGKLPAVAKGQQEKALDEAVFAAKKGDIVGPVKTQFGFYVFTVEKIVPEKVQPLKEARQSIQSLIASQKQQEALDNFVQDFRSKWKQRTTCAKGFRIPDCDNPPDTPVQRQPGQPPVQSTRPVAPGQTNQRGGLPQGPRQPPPKAPPGGALPPGGVVPGAPPGGAPQGAPPQGAPPQGAPPQGAPPPQP